MLKNSTLARAISCVIATSGMAVVGQVAAQELSEEPTELESVAVTGSRIRHDTYSSSQPVDVIVPESATVQGIGSVSDMLQASTVASGSPQVTSALSSAFVQAGGVGAETLSLRGLGANRTLVLLNGRRAGPAGVRGEVSAFDFNVLPLSVIERVEILKDGASSIYGSDAVAGVVNVITRKDDGAIADGFIGIPNESGGEESRFNFSWGKSGERGSFRVTADYHLEEELARGDRDYFSCGQQNIYDTQTGDRADIIDPRTGQPHCDDLPWGHVWVYNYQYAFTADGGNGNVPTRTRTLAQFDYDGDLGNYIPGITSDPAQPWNMTAPPGWYFVGYDAQSDAVTNSDHPYQDAQSLIPRTELITFFADGELDLTDRLSVYAEALLSRRETTANSYRQFWGYKYSEDFDFVNFTPGVGGDPMSAGWGGAVFLSPLSITNNNDTIVEVDYQRYVAGVRGDLKSGWNWDASVQFSTSDGDYTDGQVYADSIEDQDFAVGSCVGTVTSVRGVPCQDIPWLDPQFLAGNFTPEMEAFLFGNETGNTQYDQLSAEAYISGSAWELPAGPLGIAFGLHYQEDEILDTPGRITRSGNVWGSTTAGITAGEDTTKAVFAEVEVPLLADKTLAESLTLTASGRYTDVESYGSGDTYKVGINWAITPSWRLRASQGTSFRAPALFELFLADQTSFIGQRFVDPCIFWGDALASGAISQTTADNCASQGFDPDFVGGTVSATVIAGGGAGLLEAETSTNKTIGLIWTPQFADLSVSVDYFDIEVKDEVDQFGPDNIVFSCYASQFFPTDPLCQLFERDPITDGVTNIRDSFINIARQTNKGWDVAAQYRTTLPWGNLTIETQHTFQEEDVLAFFEATPDDLNGRLGDPDWSGHLNLTFDRGPWSFFWGVQFIGSSSSREHYNETTGTNTGTYRGVEYDVILETDMVDYHTVSAKYDFEDWGLTTLVGVANVFDTEPPKLSTIGDVSGEVQTAGNSAFYSQYDWTGRTYYLNLTMTF
jgi:iron complex outermembrane receptor protein